MFARGNIQVINIWEVLQHILTMEFIVAIAGGQ